jgi:hypothetical protein
VLLFQAVQSQPADLVLNGGVEPLGFVWILKGPEAASTSWLWDWKPDEILCL